MRKQERLPGLLPHPCGRSCFLLAAFCSLLSALSLLVLCLREGEEVLLGLALRQQLDRAVELCVVADRAAEGGRIAEGDRRELLPEHLIDEPRGRVVLLAIHGHAGLRQALVQRVA